MENHIVSIVFFIVAYLFGRYVWRDHKKTNEMYNKAIGKDETAEI